MTNEFNQFFSNKSGSVMAFYTIAVKKFNLHLIRSAVDEIEKETRSLLFVLKVKTAKV